MWIDTPIFYEDMQNICNADFVPWEQLRGKTIFVTGGTGLIGSTLISALLYTSREKMLNVKVLALVRDLKKAEKQFEKQLREIQGLNFIQGSVEAFPDINEPIDYVVHGASQTASKAFIEQPVETIQTAIFGTSNILKLAREKQVSGIVYLSSMEIYGHPEKGHKVTEDEIGMLSPLDIRNSYPISKILCESMCCAYAKEYSVPATIIRLTQTFGPGVHESDHRIFAEFGHCIKENRNIVLKTRGETERSYLYTADAVTAILCVLLNGTPGMAYNAANEDTYCSIAQMAEQVAEWGGVHVRYELRNEVSCGYPKALYMNLNTGKIQQMGWAPPQKRLPHGVSTLVEMYRRVILSSQKYRGV